MGCFNVSCGMSGISMYGDDAVLIPLLPASYAPCRGEKTEDGGFKLLGANIITNEGASSLYYPFLLPIFGSYDTYGKLEDVVEDTNTAALEKFFNMKIGDLQEAIAVGEQFEMPQGWHKYDHELLQNISGMFVHRKIWDTFTSQSFNEWGGDTYSAYSGADCKEAVLKILGFEFVREADAEEKKKSKKERDRYDRLWKHPQFPTVELWSDEQWIRLEIDGKEEGGIYHPNKLVSAIQKKTGTNFDPKYINAIKSTNSYDIDYGIALEHVRDRRQELAEIEKMKENPDADKERLQLLMELNLVRNLVSRESNRMFDFSNRASGSGGKLFQSIYGDVLEDPTIRDLTVKLRLFTWAMMACNRIYMPSFNGYQHGNVYMSKLLYETSLKIVQDDIEERRREDEGDED